MQKFNKKLKWVKNSYWTYIKEHAMSVSYSKILYFSFCIEVKKITRNGSAWFKTACINIQRCTLLSCHVLSLGCATTEAHWRPKDRLLWIAVMLLSTERTKEENQIQRHSFLKEGHLASTTGPWHQIKEITNTLTFQDNFYMMKTSLTHLEM